VLGPDGEGCHLWTRGLLQHHHVTATSLKVPKASRSPAPGARSLSERVEAALQAAADGFAEVEDCLVSDSVVRVVPLLAARDDARLLEEDEMLGRVLLGGADERGQLEDDRLALAQPVEELDPRALDDGGRIRLGRGRAAIYSRGAYGRRVRPRLVCRASA
jgi:hypothetical protein